MAMVLTQFLLFITFLNSFVDGHFKIDKLSHAHVFDLNLYDDVLNTSLCQEQINYLRNNDTVLLARFLDAGIRLPKGILKGNIIDYGNYYQCLRLHHDTSGSVIDGKYCMIEVPLDQPNLNLPHWSGLLDLLEWLDVPIPNSNLTLSRYNEDMLQLYRSYKQFKLGNNFKRFSPTGPLQELSFSLAVCIPKACTTRQALKGLLFNVTSMGFEYKDRFCRLPNDKPWVMVDYVALAVFSMFGLIALLSTAYDIRHCVLLRRDPKEANKIYQCFSFYTNTRRLVTYTPVPGALECLDGIRALTTMWVIVGHTFFIQAIDFVSNPKDYVDWSTSASSPLILAATISVDTFFMLSGLLLVYTSAVNLTSVKLIKNLHLFYLHRLLRLFPLLAIVVLLQASWFNHVADGPNWSLVAWNVNRCRKSWWSTLLHIQNWVNPIEPCLDHSWFLAVDVQLYILSPLVLFWILGGRTRVAWSALTIAMLLALIPASIYNIIMEFPGIIFKINRFDELSCYFEKYYVNTLTRCSPFVVGMMYGYLMHLCRGKEVIIHKLHVMIFWMFSIMLTTGSLYSTYVMMQLDWENQAMETLANSLMRPAWALAIGWIVFACVHGYGGPVNWVLSLRTWTVLGRLSYAMYIVHYPLIIVLNSSRTAPSYFSAHLYLHQFLSNYFVSVIVAFILTLLVDSPCSALLKYFMGELISDASGR